MYIKILTGAMILLMSACQSTPRVYLDASTTCTWVSVEELIICKGENPSAE